MIAAEPPRLSVAEYFQAEETTKIKNKFHHGEPFAMTGTSAPRNLVATNLTILLANFSLA
ncbi:MAG: hypothetical protein ACLFRG_18200 [Desulfococcaceae bacterium]